ncbi:uncharacterized protein LOC122509002 [Leptopilina heterotoma]|uniref:uncharacterized protein LOC122509002 n=1 Tax=Leptopilina heterotoma TaxID=63436 RepID=UPI001CA8248B|nr:uncharacterized protein LOC122509002 [Leptopilina heterotoma]
MKQIKSTYGFQESVFSALKLKTEKMDSKHRHGASLLDQMKLSTSLTFNKMNLQFEGFTNLGEHPPEHQKSELGDHALIFIFQSFMTGEIQTLGCFLSKESATSTVLHKLLIECILLAENAGLRIDLITSDGASWNHAMWKIFGVSESMTPDGLVALNVWYTILDVEDTLSSAIKVNCKLTQDHLQTKFYHKMNVALAFQFFEIADVLEVSQNKHPQLEDCEPTKNFCRKVKGLLDVMNSKSASGGMAPINGAYNAVENFLVYLENWRDGAIEKGY